MLDASQPQQSRLRELRLGNFLLHCRTKAGFATPTLIPACSSVACQSLGQFALAVRTPSKVNQLHHRPLAAVFLRKFDACFTIYGRHDRSSADVEDSHFKLFSFCARNIIANKKFQQQFESLHGGIALKSSCASIRQSPLLFFSLCVHPSRLSQILNSELLLLCWFLLELVPCRSNSQRAAHLYPSTTSRFDCDTRRCERALLKFPSIRPRILGMLLSGRTCPHPS